MFATTRRRLTGSFIAVLLSAVPATSALAGPEIPGESQQQPIALVGGTIHPVSAEVIEGGTLLFDNGKIVALGRDIELPEDVRLLDVSGRHVFPALFDANSNIGLVEINAVRATRDYNETGQINPNVSAQVAVNPDSEIIPVTRSNGVLLALAAPQGGLIAGKSAVLQLDGWTWEDLTLSADVALHVNWPTMSPVSKWMEEGGGDRGQELDQLKQVFEDARAYQRARAAENRRPVDSRWEAMLPVLSGDVPLIVVADDVAAIQAAVAFADREAVKLIIYGGYDAMECAELLKQHDVPVIVAGVYRLPRRRFDPYDAPFTLPNRLRQAGIRYCVAGTARFGASNLRNLPYHAAMAAAFGLPADEALKSVTLYPAQILGVDDRVGSLEVGKDATLFVSDGHPFVTKTQIETAFVQGRAVDLSDRHKRLWKKYQEKYRRQRRPAD